MNKDERLEVTIKYNDFKQTISGSFENVTKEYLNVLSTIIPAFQAVEGLTFGPNLAEMAKKLKNSVQIYKERIFILAKTPSTEDRVLLCLVAKYIGFGLKLTTNDSMSSQEIINSTGKTKTVVLRVLGKLKSQGAVELLLDNTYRILDWKAYDFILKKFPERSKIKLTDFVEKDGPYRLPVFTIGYEGHEPTKFLELLIKENISILVDVRKDAYSKQDISYSEGNLSKNLAKEGIKYIHIPELGVDYTLRQELKSTHDYAAYFGIYSQYLDENTCLTELVAGMAQNNLICLMCYEKDFKFCHRSILANKLEAYGITVRHL